MRLVRSLRLRHFQQRTLISQRRSASSESHGHEGEHHHHVEDTTVYPKETFFNPFWRNTVILSVAAYAGYSLLSRGDDRSWVTNAISGTLTSHEEMDRENHHKLALIAQAAEDARTIAAARRPHIHRYRYTGHFDAGSPNILALGSQPDMSNVDVRRDYQRRHGAQKSEAEEAEETS